MGEISDIENRKLTEKINETEHQLFEKFIKTNRPLASLTIKKRGKVLNIKIRYEKKDYHY